MTKHQITNKHQIQKQEMTEMREVPAAKSFAHPDFEFGCDLMLVI
jgi:hypothetical protein